MARKSGRKQVLAIGADDQTAPVIPTDNVVYLRNVDLSGDSPEVSVTSAGDNWQQFVAGSAPGATLTATFVTDVDGANTFQGWDEWVTGNAYQMAWLPEGEGSGLPEITFLGVVLQHSTTSAYDGAIEGTVQIRVTSLPTFAAQGP